MSPLHHSIGNHHGRLAMIDSGCTGNRRPWYELLKLKPSTKKQYHQQKERFRKVHMVNKPIKSIVHSDIKAALQKGTSSRNKSCNNQLSIIRGIFDLAMLDKQILANPCAGLDYATVQTKGPDPFTLTEVRAILGSLAKWYKEPIVNFVQFQFFAGLRTSEAMALEWSNVDFNKAEILVESVVVYEEEQDSTKTNTARKVKLTTEAMAALLKQNAHTFAADGKVFSDPYYDAPWLYHRITTGATFLKTTLKRLGIRHRRAYNTRHTYHPGTDGGSQPRIYGPPTGPQRRDFF